jgi:hypothetical protein
LWQQRASYALQFVDEGSVVALLKGTPSASIPNTFLMAVFFVLALGCGASAFILTGLRDYLQSELGLSDRQLIDQQTVATRKERFDIDGAPGLYGTVEYSPGISDIDPLLSGPVCTWHDEEVKPEEIDQVSGKVTKWFHRRQVDGKPQIFECFFQGQLTVGELDRRFRESALKAITS